MTEPCIITIDPATHSGLSAWSRGRLVCVAETEVPKRCPVQTLVIFLRDILGHLVHPDPATVRVVVEYWNIPRGFQAARVLHRIKEAWLDAAAELGITHTSEVLSDDWQQAMGCVGERAERKRLARAIAADTMRRAGLPTPRDHEDLDEDVADAVCLGLYFLEEQQRVPVVEVLSARGRDRKAARAASGSSRWTEADVTAHLARMGR